ncbi:MAG: hypothetical protein IPI06_09335 [Gammaproteobacteria bacterium]|nr:hypothetical protein [Gammaproteobacteria bacterium]
MQPDESPTQVVACANLREFFRDAVHGALGRQQTTVAEDTEQYVVNLLTLFARSEALFESTPEGLRTRPLVVMLAEALEASSPDERNRGLQRLGDVSLFIAGFFAQSFARRLIDIDYHIAMGGRAYGTLAGSLRGSRSRVFVRIFGELAAKFQPIVDALNEVSESSCGHSARDILRLYEIWMKTGSRRAGVLLRSLGVEPVAQARAGRAH